MTVYLGGLIDFADLAGQASDNVMLMFDTSWKMSVIIAQNTMRVEVAKMVSRPFLQEKKRLVSFLFRYRLKLISSSSILILGLTT